MYELPENGMANEDAYSYLGGKEEFKIIEIEVYKIEWFLILYIYILNFGLLIFI